MKNRNGRVIRVWKSVDCRHEAVDSEQAADPVAAGYYYLLPKAATKKRRKSAAPHSVDVYGPFVSSSIARLIETSAHAFGVVADESSMSPVAAREVADHVSMLPDSVAPRRAYQPVIVRRNDHDNVVRLAARP